MRIILLGPPGAGKGTQAKFISDHFKIPNISTGDILRQAILDQSELGKKIAELVERGGLVSDDMVNQLVQQRLQQDDCQSGFLLDGYPRTIDQAKALDKIAPIDYVVELELPNNEIIARLTGRRVHPGSGRTYHVIHNPPKHAGFDDMTGEPLIQRKDDSQDTVLHRLEVYERQTSPVKEYYANKAAGSAAPVYLKINADGPVDLVRKHIFSALDKGNLAYETKC